MDSSQQERVDERIIISDIKADSVGSYEKPEYFNIVGTVGYIPKKNIYYTACTTPKCNKKVFQDGTDQWRCEKCARSMPSCDYR